MEYDRALYRVYERMLDDLNSSQPLLSAAENDTSINDVTAVEPSPRDGDVETGHGGNTTARDARPAQRPSMHRRAMIGSRQLISTAMQQRRRSYLPFVLPIWMARKIESRRTSDLFGVAWLREIFRGRSGANYHHLETASSTETTPNQLSTASTSAAHRHDDETSGLALTPLTINNINGSSSQGLRRRSPTSRRSPSVTEPPDFSLPDEQTSAHGRTLFTLQPRLREDRSSSQSSSSTGTSQPPSSFSHSSPQHHSSESDETDDSHSMSSGSLDDDDSTESSRSQAGITGCTTANVYRAMRASMIVGFVQLFILMILHSTYVGPFAFRAAKVPASQGAISATSRDYGDSNFNCISRALSTRPNAERSKYYALFGEGDKYDENGNEAYQEENHQGHKVDAEGQGQPLVNGSVVLPLLGKDEILQIKILYGRKCQGECSRVRKVVYESNETVANETSIFEEGDQYSKPSFWREDKIHYRFAIDSSLLYIDENSALLHGINVVNLTVTERCLSTGSDHGRPTLVTGLGEALSQIYGMDTVIINQLMYGIRLRDGQFTQGHVQSLATKERWGWQKELLEGYESISVIHWILRKIATIFMSLLSFVLITSVTSLIVRVLTSSGVVLMFPLFELLRELGLRGAQERILSLSYPWIGVARLQISMRRTFPQSHLIAGHVCKVILYYVMYEACQAAWSVVLYAKSVPEALPVWIYGFAMIWEYFSMVFVRSALAVHFFPRICCLYYMFWHFYFYSCPYGYMDVALIPWFCFMTVSSTQYMVYVFVTAQMYVSALARHVVYHIGP